MNTENATCCQYSVCQYIYYVIILPDLKNLNSCSSKTCCPSDSRLCVDHLIGTNLHPDIAVDIHNRGHLENYLIDRSE